LQCERPISARATAKYCCDGCRSAHWRRRKRIGRRLALRPRCATCRKALPLIARSDARYCSSACKQRAHRARARKAAPSAKAHQRVVKDRLATGEDGAGLDIRRAVVREISLAEARAIVEPYELLRPLHAVSRFAFGFFFGDRCGGAVVYGAEYGENLGVWDKYGFTGKIICLQRGACLPWAHPHAASELVRRSMALLPAKYKVVTATVDPAAGEIGIVYQAAGFVYVGSMTKGGRAAITLPDGTRISERTGRRIVGTGGARALAQMGFDAASTPRKERYFAFRGSRREQRKLRAAIAALVKPYPKRPLGSVSG
jgi:hypothetical protein